MSISINPSIAIVKSADLCINQGVAIEGQPVWQNYYHRTLSDSLNLAFDIGFYLERLDEIPFDGQKTPIIFRVRIMGSCLA